MCDVDFICKNYNWKATDAYYSVLRSQLETNGGSFLRGDTKCETKLSSATNVLLVYYSILYYIRTCVVAIFVRSSVATLSIVVVVVDNGINKTEAEKYPERSCALRMPPLHRCTLFRWYDVGTCERGENLPRSAERVLSHGIREFNVVFLDWWSYSKTVGLLKKCVKKKKKKLVRSLMWVACQFLMINRVDRLNCLIDTRRIQATIIMADSVFFFFRL